MGGDAIFPPIHQHGWLKSTPPAWAGTPCNAHDCQHDWLKSTPPAWAGTQYCKYSGWYSRLKSTPPAWAGTIDYSCH